MYEESTPSLGAMELQHRSQLALYLACLVVYNETNDPTRREVNESVASI